MPNLMKRPLISFKAPVKIRLSALGLICVSLVGLSACGPRPDGKKGPDEAIGGSGTGDTICGHCQW